MKSLIDNSVNLGGKQNVRGLKEFSADVAANDLNDTSHYNMIIKCKTIDNKVAPLSGTDFGGIDFRDQNNLRIAKIEVSHQSDNSVRSALSASRIINNKFAFANIESGLDAQGKSLFIFGQMINGKNPGYFKIPTGNPGQYFVICGGTVTTGSAVTFPISITNVIGASLTMILNENAGYSAYIGALSTTSLSARRYNNTPGTHCRWMVWGFRNE